MSKGKKCTSKECRRFERSQAAHRVLAESNRKKSYSAKSDSAYMSYYIRSSYHKDVAECQSHIGRVLTKTERKKAFSYEKKTNGNVDLRFAFKK